MAKIAQEADLGLLPTEKGSDKYQVKPEYSAWERNVIDEYKPLSNEEIKAKVAERRLPFAVLMTHLNIDYNLGAVIRVANALGAEVFYFGKKKFDKRGACGVYNYTNPTYLSSISEVSALKARFAFIALEQTPQSENIMTFKYPERPCLFLLGEESRGLTGTPEVFNLADYCVSIPQVGSVRSLNAATAFAIAAYDFRSKYEISRS